MIKVEPEYMTTRILSMLELYSRNEALKILEECIYYVDVRKDLFK
jgi:hypothetical protein